MEEQKKNSIEYLEGLAIKKLTKILEDNDEPKPWQLEVAKLASTTRSTNSRLAATKRVQDATQFSIIKVISKDIDETRKYVKATLPEYYPED